MQHALVDVIMSRIISQVCCVGGYFKDVGITVECEVPLVLQHEPQIEFCNVPDMNR